MRAAHNERERDEEVPCLNDKRRVKYGVDLQDDGRVDVSNRRVSDKPAQEVECPCEIAQDRAKARSSCHVGEVVNCVDRLGA